MPVQTGDGVAAVEREVDLRLARWATARPSSACRAAPNPGARLYLRVFEGALPNLHRDEIMLSTIRAARLICAADAADAPSLEIFGEAVRAAVRALSREERAALALHNRHMLQLLAACEVEEPASSAAK